MTGIIRVARIALAAALFSAALAASPVSAAQATSPTPSKAPVSGVRTFTLNGTHGGAGIAGPATIYCEVIAFDPVKNLVPSILGIGAAQCKDEFGQLTPVASIDLQATLYLDNGTVEGPTDFRFAAPGARLFAAADLKACISDVYGTAAVAVFIPPAGYTPPYLILGDQSNLVALTCP